MEFLGKVHDEELAQKMASGIINPRTLKPYDEVALKSLKKIASSQKSVRKISNKSSKSKIGQKILRNQQFET